MQIKKLSDFEYLSKHIGYGVSVENRNAQNLLVRGMFFGTLNMDFFNDEIKVYVAKCDGHSIDFIIDNNISLCKETYYSQRKTSTFSLKSKKIDRKELLFMAEGGVLYNGEPYYTHPTVIENCGDFSFFYSDFTKLKATEQLNVCRNIKYCKKRASFKYSFEKIVADHENLLTLPIEDFTVFVK